MKCIGIDGESISPFGYCLLSNSLGGKISERERISSRDCFEFILGTAKQADRVFGYGIGYDVCHWVADLSSDEKTRLATKGMCYTFQGPTCYRLTYRPNAYFTVQKMKGGPWYPDGKEIVATATVVDLMRWHRKPFVDVCEEWDTLDVNPFWLRKIKDNREGFHSDEGRLISDYCDAECRSLSRLGEQMTSRLSDLGIPVSHPFTAGAVAGALMARNKVQDHWQPAPEGVQDAISRAFFGGREQCNRYGYFKDVTQWDIRSAYGWAMTQLPDMLGRWETCPYLGNKCIDLCPEWSIYKVQWDIDEGKHPVMPFPWRSEDGRVHYPPRGTGWQWSPIVRGAMRHYPGSNIRILDAFHYIPSGNNKPFGYVSDLFNARREAGNDPVSGLIKSIIVATWGRLCSPGQRRSKTRGMLDWAGMTTALIQERMLDAIHATGEDEFISACVDGFWTTSTKRLDDTCDTLGSWSKTPASELLLLRPACYWKRSAEGAEAFQGGDPEGERLRRVSESGRLKDAAGGWSAHTSGIPGGGELVEAALEQWRTVGGWRRGRLDLTQRRVKGLLACSVDGDYDQLGQFVDLPLSLAFNPGQGRMGHECPTMKHGDTWRRWNAYWPPAPAMNAESASFISRTGLIDNRWKERQEANAIEETSE